MGELEAKGRLLPIQSFIFPRHPLILVYPVNAYLYYFAVIVRNIEEDESDAAIPGGAEARHGALRPLWDRFRRRPTGYGGQVAWVTARYVDGFVKNHHRAR